MDKLKPCPFCGGEAYIEIICNGLVEVRCKGCYASVPAKYQNKAVERWNRRADNEPHKWQDKQE